MKRLPIAERKVSTTFALSLKALEKLDDIQERHFPGKSRSYTMEEIIATLYNMWFPEDDETPDDVSEVGYDPYSGCYTEDL